MAYLSCHTFDLSTHLKIVVTSIKTCLYRRQATLRTNRTNSGTVGTGLANGPGKTTTACGISAARRARARLRS